VSQWEGSEEQGYRAASAVGDSVGESKLMHQPEKEASSRPKSHASASYRLYVHFIWPTKYRKPILGLKLTPVVENKISEVCRTILMREQ
jgi:hypothetical protein